MKKFIKFLFILFLLAVLCASTITCIIYASAWVKKNRSYDGIYATQADKKLAQIIENSVYIISNSKAPDISTEKYKEPAFNELKKYELDIELNDISYACYSESIYGVDVQTILNNIGIKNKYASLIEDKKQSGLGEGSSLLMFVKKDRNVIPVFISAYFYLIQSKLKFFENGSSAGCVKIPNEKLHIKIDSSLKEKALIIME